MLTPGDTFAGYTVVRELGKGGMGAVYLVRHPRLPRTDALKVLRRELCADPDYTRRFLREAELVAGLSHRNVVPVLDRGEHEGQLWLTMPYVEGSDAEAALASAGGRFGPDRAVHVVAEVAGALDAAHRQGLVHRDVKPANILLRPGHDDEPEQVYLTDFGIAKPLEAGSTRLTRTGMVIATFDYASPEQVESRPLSSRSDVYSLGCVLHKLLTGSVPFPGDTLFAALHGHVSLPPPRPSALVPGLPPGLDDVVARAMAKDPADRFPTCRALAAAARTSLAATAAAPRTPAPPTVIGPTTPFSVPRATDDERRTWPLGPGIGPSPDPEVPPPPKRRRPGRLLVLLVLVVAVAAVTTVVLLDPFGASRRQDASPNPSGTVPPTATPDTAAAAAWAALPRSDAPIPDQTVVVGRVVDGGGVLLQVDTRTGAETQLTAGTDDANSPVITPDRRSVAFRRTAADGTVELAVTAADGGPVTPLLSSTPTGCQQPGRPAWNPVDPTELALPCVGSDGVNRLLLVTLDGGIVRVLDPGPRFDDVAFSPDGTQVVYWASAGDAGGGPLWALDVAGGAPTQLTSGSDADPDWSAAGIVFRRVAADGTAGICVLPAAGAAVDCITAGAVDQDPSWSPDSSQIAFKSNRDAPSGLSRTWAMAADGSDARQLAVLPADVDEPSAPAWGVR